MRKHLILTAVLLLLSSVALFAQGETDLAASENGIDWFELTILTGYLLGVFILLPIVIYTNLKEKIFVPDSDNQQEIELIDGMDEDERNNRAALILESIEEKLTSFQSEDGEDLVTITNGKQAKFMKRGLDYITKKLAPTNKEIIERVNEFADVYKDRTQRAFTGSKWIIMCSAGVGVLFFLTGGISGFLFIHFLGLLFYILASRTTFYSIEKRMEYLGRTGGMIGSIMSGLFMGDGVKYYIKHSDGSKTRDWETEGQMAIVGLMIMVFVALILGFFAAFLGVINSILNYSTSYLLPFKSDDDWYADNFATS